MNCPRCGKALPRTSRTCPACARQPVELLTEEPAAAAPARAPSFARPRRRLPLRTSTRSGFTIGGIATVLLIVGGLGLKVCRVSKSVFGQTVENQVYTLPPEGDYGGTLEVSGSHSYTFTVSALDGPVHMGITRLAGKGPPGRDDILRLIASAKEVGKGASQTLTGRFSSGTYFWTVMNVSESDSARAKVSLSAR